MLKKFLIFSVPIAFVFILIEYPEEITKIPLFYKIIFIALLTAYSVWNFFKHFPNNSARSFFVTIIIGIFILTILIWNNSSPNDHLSILIGSVLLINVIAFYSVFIKNKPLDEYEEDENNN